MHNSRIGYSITVSDINALSDKTGAVVSIAQPARNDEHGKIAERWEVIHRFAWFEHTELSPRPLPARQSIAGVLESQHVVEIRK
jgi:hypothetical protein